MMYPRARAAALLVAAAAFTVSNVQGADNDVERVRNPFVSKDDLGPLMRNYNSERSFGRSMIPGFQQDSTFPSNPSGCFSCNYGNGGSRTYGVDSLNAPQSTSTRREYRKEQKFVNGQPVYDFHHERQYQDGQLVHEDRNERGEDDLGLSSQNLGFLEQRGLGRTSYQRNSQSSTSDNLQSSSSDLNRYGSDGYIIPQSSSTREEFRTEQKFVNGQPVYDLQHERKFQDGRLVHEDKQERDEDDFGVSSGFAGNVGQRGYSSSSRQSSAHSQSSNIGDSGDIGTDFNADTSRLRQKLQEQMRTFRTKPRLSTVGASERSETRTESRHVNGQPVYARNEEHRYEDDNLVHSNIEEKGPDDFGTRQLINSAAHGTYSTGRSRSNQQNYNNQQSGIRSRYPVSGSQRRTNIAREQTKEQRSTSYRPSYTPSRTSISTQQSGDHSSTSYRPTYTPTRTSGYSEETQRQESSSLSSSSQPGYRPSGSSSNRPNNRRTDYSHQSNQEENSQNSQVGQTYGSTSGSSYRPTGSSTTYREESQNQESATYSASRPSNGNPSTNIIVEGEEISHSSSNESPSASPSRRAEGDKPAIYNHSYFAKTNTERRKAVPRDRSRGVYNGPRRVDLDLSETNGLNEHLVGSDRHNTQSAYDGSSQYSRGSSNDRSYGSSSYDGSYSRSSSAYGSNTESDISTLSNVNDNHIDQEYDEDYAYENTHSESSYNEDENNNRLNKERYDISPYDGIENIPEVDNEVETSYIAPDSHSQPGPTDYNSYGEVENRDSQEQHEQVTTRSPVYTYDNQAGGDIAQGYPQTSHTSSASGYNYTSHNREVIPSTDHRQSSYDYSNNEVQQSSYPAVPYGGHESSRTNYEESQEQSSISSGVQYAPSSSSSHSSSRATEERRENVFDSGAYGPGVIISSPHTKTRRTELRTKKKYVNGQLIGLTFYERVYENGNLIHENITERGRDDLTQEELQQYGISMAEFDQPIYNQGGSYSQKQEVTQKKKFVNGQQIYDLHHERQYEDGRLVHENRTEQDEDDLGVSGYNRHGSSGYAVGSNTDTYNVAESQYGSSGHVVGRNTDSHNTDSHNVAQSQYGSSGHAVGRNTDSRNVAESQYSSSGYAFDRNTDSQNVAQSQYGSSGYAVDGNTDTHNSGQSQYNSQHVLEGTVAHSTEDRQVTDRHIVNTVPHYTSRREEVRTQQKFVNGVPVYDLQQEKKYVDGQLVHENKTELTEDELRIKFGHRDALQDILSGNTLSTARDGYYYGNAGNYGSSAYEQSQSSSSQSRTSNAGLSGQGISGGAQTVGLDLGSGGHQSQSSYSDSQMGTSLLSGHSSAGSGGARTLTLDLGSSSTSQGLGDQLLGSGGHQSQSSYSDSSSYDSSSSYGTGSQTSTGGGAGRSTVLGVGSVGSDSSTNRRGGEVALTSVMGLGSVGSGVQGGHSSYSSSSTSENESQSTGVGGGYNFGSSNLAGSDGAHRDQQSSYGSSSSYEASQMGTSLLSGHSSAGSGGARTLTLDLGSSSSSQGVGDQLLGSGGHRDQQSSYGSSSSYEASHLGSSSSQGLGDQLLGSGHGHQSGSSAYESGSSYGSSSSSSGSSGCVSCAVNTGGSFGASASGLTGGGAHGFSQGHEMSKEERYENGELVHGHESERDFENGQLVREQSRQYGGRNADQSSGSAQGGPLSSSSSSSSSSSYSSSSQSSYGDANGIGVKMSVTGSSEGVCADNPCQNGGTCISGLRGALCVCTFGFKGKRCDEAYCPTRFCRYKGACSIEDDQHVCSCRDGHTGLRCGTRSRRHTNKHRRRHASHP